MLIKCPECTKDVSDTVAVCPHCGYVLKVATLAPQPHPQQRSAVFQYISLGAAVVALFTPMILVAIPCLVVISAGIFSLVRREPRWLLSLASVALSLFIVGSGPSISKTDTSYMDKMQIQNWDYTTEGNYGYVRGRVKNIGDRTVSYFKVTAYYKDASGRVIDIDFTNSGEDLQPGMAKEFEIMHRDSPEYETYSVAIDEVHTK